MANRLILVAIPSNGDPSATRIIVATHAVALGKDDRYEKGS
ncbi:hypothetical protein [Defluviicoccus vanus]|nr:hypothetical protein [Defluviicoccus vanus]